MSDNLDVRHNLELYKDWSKKAVKFWQEIAKVRNETKNSLLAQC